TWAYPTDLQRVATLLFRSGRRTWRNQRRRCSDGWCLASAECRLTGSNITVRVDTHLFTDKYDKLTMKTTLWKTAMPMLALLSLLACGKDSGPTPEPPGNGGSDGVTVENVTYANFAGALLQSKCSSCHAGSG